MKMHILKVTVIHLYVKLDIYYLYWSSSCARDKGGIVLQYKGGIGRWREYRDLMNSINLK